MLIVCKDGKCFSMSFLTLILLFNLGQSMTVTKLPRQAAKQSLASKIPPKPPAQPKSPGKILSNSDYCKSPVEKVAKFFILNELLFVTRNVEYFETFRIFNLSSGAITERHNASGLVPSFRSMMGSILVSDYKSIGGARRPNKLDYRLVWAFIYDVDVESCEFKAPEKGSSSNEEAQAVPIVYDAGRYCSRVENVHGIIVARLSNLEVIFMRYNTRKFTIVHDNNNYMEFKVLIKHLDTFGYISSVTFNQKTNQFISTHYGRHMELCITIVLHKNTYKVPLPMMDELLEPSLFQTSCFSTQHSYSSVIDIDGSLYAISIDNNVDHIHPNVNNLNFDVIQSNTDKLFFNCYLNSPVVIEQPTRSRSFQPDDDYDYYIKPLEHNSIDDDNAGSRKKVANRNLDNVVRVHNRDGEENGEEGGFSWPLFIFYVVLVSALILLGWLTYKRKIDYRYWCTMCRSCCSGAVSGAKQANTEYRERKQREQQQAKEASGGSTLGDNKSSLDGLSNLDLKDDSKMAKGDNASSSTGSALSHGSSEAPKNDGKTNEKQQPPPPPPSKVNQSSNTITNASSTSSSQIPSRMAWPWKQTGHRLGQTDFAQTVFGRIKQQLRSMIFANPLSKQLQSLRTVRTNNEDADERRSTKTEASMLSNDPQLSMEDSSEQYTVSPISSTLSSLLATTTKAAHLNPTGDHVGMDQSFELVSTDEHDDFSSLRSVPSSIQSRSSTRTSFRQNCRRCHSSFNQLTTTNSSFLSTVHLESENLQFSPSVHNNNFNPFAKSCLHSKSSSSPMAKSPVVFFPRPQLSLNAKDHSHSSPSPHDRPNHHQRKLGQTLNQILDCYYQNEPIFSSSSSSPISTTLDDNPRENSSWQLAGDLWDNLIRSSIPICNSNGQVNNHKDGDKQVEEDKPNLASNSGCALIEEYGGDHA